MHSKAVQEATRRFGISGGIRLLAATVGVVAALGACQSAHAETLFGTSLAGRNLFKADTTAMTVTPVFDTPAAPDSLLFDPSGRLIYDEFDAGDLRRFDPVANTDVQLASGFIQPVDIVLDPSGKTMLLTNRGAGEIDRIDLTTDVVTPLATGLNTPDGLAYDKSGHLFAVVRNGVDQLDPVTGAILNQSGAVASDFLDGLTFDPFSGKLYATQPSAGAVFEIDPSNLTSFSQLTTGIPNADGLTTDAMGNLWIAASGFSGQIFQYNLPTNTLTPNVAVEGLDDLAPASGQGAPPPPPTGVVPEPCSLTLLALGGLPLLRRRRRAAA